jgi:N-acetylneuraminate synthase
MNNCIYTAEIGVNHNGDLNNVFKLINLAKKHGFDYVKFQKRDIDSCYTKEYLDSPRESPWGKTQRGQKEVLELYIDDYKNIETYCQVIGIKWYYSPWDIKSAKLMSRFKTDYVKIAKACLTNNELLDYYKNTQDKLILSINNFREEDSYNLMKWWNKCNISYVLSCVSLYPSPINFNGLSEIMKLYYNKIFTNKTFDIGYSNHSPHWIHPVIASYLGAKMVEVHITLDKNMYGSDQKSSLDDNDLTNMMMFKNYELSVEEIYKYLEQENEVLKKLRQTW